MPLLSGQRKRHWKHQKRRFDAINTMGKHPHKAMQGLQCDICILVVYQYPLWPMRSKTHRHQKEKTTRNSAKTTSSRTWTRHIIAKTHRRKGTAQGGPIWKIVVRRTSGHTSKKNKNILSGPYAVWHHDHMQDNRWKITSKPRHKHLWNVIWLFCHVSSILDAVKKI